MMLRYLGGVSGVMVACALDMNEKYGFSFSLKSYIQIANDVHEMLCSLNDEARIFRDQKMYKIRAAQWWRFCFK
ncbi:hypothetical protein KIN20_020924 [Parelaphostrongylus tenuis]|uniref:Uncharacterized protein n=1 Tax=Parelaphostrongylus tenuis TaxID=148309 RepID=A0AAD5MX43_PARTN|nr:hypothetical protein KIN20_014258 [Parelaphostrongylus tenuis]KAJ1361629.1 hypothetical protein KIN20_020924 [Parelaphostrongylus tenuis]